MTGASRLTDLDRDIIAQARQIGPGLRASGGDRERLAGWLLLGLADLADRLGGHPAAQTTEADHG